MGFRYMRADELMTLYGTVSGGTIADEHELDWLVDGRPGFPARATSGSVIWTVTGATAKEVGCIVVANHNRNAGGAFSITGDITTSVPTATVRPYGVPWNGYVLVDPPVVCDELSVGVTGNTDDVVIGEFLAGKLRETSHGALIDDLQHLLGAQLPQSPYAGLSGYDDGVAQRQLSFHVICEPGTTEELELEDFWESTKASTLPSVIFPYQDDRIDAWVGRLTAFRPVWDDGVWTVEMQFVEMPRCRW